MAGKQTLKLAVIGNADITDAVLARGDGGSRVDRGVKEMVARSYPDHELIVDHYPSPGLSELRSELESDRSTFAASRPHLVLLSIAEEVLRLGSRGQTPETAVRAVKDDLEAVIRIIKQDIGAHVLILNVSTLDPSDATITYHALAEEPFGLRAHRLDLMLVEVSHQEGISIIDVDRLLAELGGRENVEAAARYGPRACERIAAEVVRVIADYGFLDDRPLLAQVGARVKSG